jgi:hypothetical protein
VFGVFRAGLFWFLPLLVSERDDRVLTVCPLRAFFLSFSNSFPLLLFEISKSSLPSFLFFFSKNSQEKSALNKQ